ncbi:TetR/AcrR family transcriptional regulator [Roseovarius faecimaris]|uniref:TetR/AcrR family transcriptional regulator n=1 Tax=Roseovarius faecimaris TaxID=2494550 RepID=UPI0018E0367A|nr:TetR family transcriptional regulator C-terminal domain-containing protein [Roseovarius faecimaris]
MPIASKLKPEKRPRTHPEINEYRRRTLIEGALRSLAEHGVSGTTVSTISKSAGASRGLLGHYFENKDEVMVAALEYLFGRIAETVRAVVETTEGATNKLLAVPASLFSAATFTELNRTAFLALWHETRFNAKVRAANRRLYRDYIIRMELLVRAAAEEQGVKIDARQVALTFIALSDGLWLGLSIHDDVLTGDQAVAICQGHIKRELGIP